MTRRRKARISLAQPGYDGKFEIGIRAVDDPYEPGRRINVAHNVRASSVVYLHSRRLIDDAQMVAAERFRELYEAAEIGGAVGIDHSRPVVDGGHIARSGPSEVVAQAVKELSGIRLALGMRCYGLLVVIIGHGVSLYAYAARIDGIGSHSTADSSRHTRRAVSQAFTLALNRLVLHFGVVTGPPRHREGRRGRSRGVTGTRQPEIA